MGYAQRLIARILADGRAAKDAPAADDSRSQKVYRDEPILFTGADLLKTQQTVEPACELPALLQRLREMERKADAFILPENRLFVEQAQLAAAYEDDYRYEGEFRHYFPTYRHMTDEQLRGYFGWRTRWNQGQRQKTSLSYAFVRLYELVNSVGAANAQAGFQALRQFCHDYGEIDSKINQYARTWMHDYVIFHGLDERLLETIDNASSNTGSNASTPAKKDASKPRANVEKPAGPTPDAKGAAALSHDEALLVLLQSDAESSADDERLFSALVALSSYRLDQSRLLKHDADALCTIACGTWRALSAYYRSHRKRTLFEHFFGVRSAQPYVMFRSAVFWQEKRHPAAEYHEGPITRYLCTNGRWMCEKFHLASARSTDLGLVMKSVDAQLRQRIGFPHPLKGAEAPKYVQGIIEKQIDALLAEREENARREAERKKHEISIDFSKLAGIRSAAANTCEALLVDEERDEEQQNSEPVPSPAENAGLSAYETAYLHALLHNDSHARQEAVRASGVTEDMLLDAVNEKLYDVLGDIAISDESGAPALLEDYEDEVKELIEA